MLPRCLPSASSRARPQDSRHHKWDPVTATPHLPPATIIKNIKKLEESFKVFRSSSNGYRLVVSIVATYHLRFDILRCELLLLKKLVLSPSHSPPLLTFFLLWLQVSWILGPLELLLAIRTLYQSLANCGYLVTSRTLHEYYVLVGATTRDD